LRLVNLHSIEHSELSQIAHLVHANLDAVPEDLQLVRSQPRSKTYFFRAQNSDLVFRVRKDAWGIAKDRIASELFQGSVVSVPKVLCSGEDAGFHYSIVERCKGRTAFGLPEEDYAMSLPSILHTHEHIRKTSTDFIPSGCGQINLRRTCSATDWRSYLLNIKNNARYGWKTFVDEQRLDRTFLEEVFGKFEELVPFCHERRDLFHGDYGYANLFVDQGAVTGVIDWEGMGIGDHLFDVGVLDFWYPAHYHRGFGSHRRVLADYYSEIGEAAEHFAERTMSYMIRVGLDNLSVLLARCDLTAKWVENRLRQLIQASPAEF